MDGSCFIGTFPSGLRIETNTTQKDTYIGIESKSNYIFSVYGKIEGNAR